MLAATIAAGPNVELLGAGAGGGTFDILFELGGAGGVVAFFFTGTGVGAVGSFCASLMKSLIKSIFSSITCLSIPCDSNCSMNDNQLGSTPSETKPRSGS